MSIATTAGILFIFVSTMRIGPFRTALIMNLEPLMAMIISAFALGEVITPIQGPATRSCWARWLLFSCGGNGG